jgi:F-type H+-transporting ATPase subunit a
MELHVELAAETLFYVGPIPVTNSMLVMFLVMGFLLIVGSAIARRAQIVPTSHAQSLAEVIVEFLLGLVESTAGKRAGRRIFPLVGAIFIFILFANYSALIPGVGVFGYYQEETPESAVATEGEHETESGAATDEEHATETDETTLSGQPETVVEEGDHQRVLVPFLRAPNADLNMTLAMALLTFTVVQVAGIRAHGVGGRIKHMADPWWIFPLEVVQEVARIVSLSFRLFGNVFAGEVLLAVMVALANAIKFLIVPLLFPVIFLFLELLFGTIQALVFALLTLIYITLATSGGHDEAEHGEEHSHEPAIGHAAAPVPAAGAD